MIRLCIANGCTHVFSSDADEIWHFNPRELAKTTNGKNNVRRIQCKLYVPTIYDDKDEPDPIKRMRYYVTKGRTTEESQCIAAWGKVFFSTAGYTGIELGNDSVYINGKREKGKPSTDGYIAHYPNRCWEQFRNKVIIGGEAWRNSKLPETYGWHIRKQYHEYFTGGIVGLKRLWYQMQEDRKGVLTEDK